MSAFWEPVTRTSMSHSSKGTGKTPTAVTPSTRNNGPFFVSFAISFTGWSTVVDVSLAWIMTLWISGCSSSCFSTSATLTACPHSTLTSMGSRPNALEIFSHRSPNLPPLITKTLSPGENRFATAASIAPVPEEASIRTSPFVPKSVLRPWRASSKILLNWGVRW